MSLEQWNMVIKRDEKEFYNTNIQARSILALKNHVRELLRSHPDISDKLNGSIRWKSTTKGLHSGFDHEDIRYEIELSRVVEEVEKESDLVPVNLEYFHISGFYGGLIMCSDGRYADTVIYTSSDNKSVSESVLHSEDYYEILLNEAKSGGSDLESEFSFWQALQLVKTNRNFMRKHHVQDQRIDLSEIREIGARAGYEYLSAYVGVGERNFSSEG